MKTLNEYIKESILDDEDVLIGNSIKDTQNPFRVLKIKYDELKNSYRAWERYAEEVMSKIPLPKGVRYFVGKNFIKIFIESTSTTLFEISFSCQTPILPKNACCLLVDNTLSTNLKGKIGPNALKFIKSFIKKYDFEHIDVPADKFQGWYYLEK
jgi:hypothetical protein